MSDRLKWMRDGDGFVAYLDGPNISTRTAHIVTTHTRPRGTNWQWRVHYDGTTAAGWVADRQAAADAANEALPGVFERARVAAAEKRVKEQLEALIDRQARRADVPIDEFGIPDSSSERLRGIIAHARGHFGGSAVPPNLKSLLDACSAELYRRRLSGAT